MGYYFTIAKIVGQNLKKKRQDSGINQTQLGIRLNLSQQMISDFENGKVAPNSAYLIELAKIFNCTTDEFYE